MAMARMRRVCLASAVRAAAARNCEILRFWRVISIADMLPAPRINDVLHRVTLAAVWESPQESGSQAAGISPGAILPRRLHAAWPDRGHRVSEQGCHLRYPVQGIGRDDDHDRGRSKTPGRTEP